MVNRKGCTYLITCFFIWVALVLMIFGCLAGCSPQRKATRKFDKAVKAHEPTVAKLTKDRWPYIPTKPDTVVTYLKGRTDTLIKEQLVLADCPDTARNAPINSVIKVPVKVPCKCEEKQPDTLYRYITQFEKDPRDSIVYTEQLRVKDKQISKAEAGRGTWRTIALVIAVIFALYVILSRIFRLF